MGIAQLVEAFNAVTGPRLTCDKALLGYENLQGIQWQRITFSGMDADGEPFSVRSARLRPNSDVVAAAVETAQKWLLDNPAQVPARSTAPTADIPNGEKT